jgi:hypothetical protein
MVARLGKPPKGFPGQSHDSSCPLVLPVYNTVRVVLASTDETVPRRNTVIIDRRCMMIVEL